MSKVADPSWAEAEKLQAQAPDTRICMACAADFLVRFARNDRGPCDWTIKPWKDGRETIAIVFHSAEDRRAVARHLGIRPTPPAPLPLAVTPSDGKFHGDDGGDLHGRDLCSECAATAATALRGLRRRDPVVVV